MWLLYATTPDTQIQANWDWRDSLPVGLRDSLNGFVPTVRRLCAVLTRANLPAVAGFSICFESTFWGPIARVSPGRSLYTCEQLLAFDQWCFDTYEKRPIIAPCGGHVPWNPDDDGPSDITPSGGVCWLELFQPCYRGPLALALGRWPTLGVVDSVPARARIEDAWSFTRPVPGRMHVRRLGLLSCPPGSWSRCMELARLSNDLDTLVGGEHTPHISLYIRKKTNLSPFFKTRLRALSVVEMQHLDGAANVSVPARSPSAPPALCEEEICRQNEVAHPMFGQVIDFELPMSTGSLPPWERESDNFSVGSGEWLPPRSPVESEWNGTSYPPSPLVNPWDGNSLEGVDLSFLERRIPTPDDEESVDWDDHFPVYSQPVLGWAACSEGSGSGWAEDSDDGVGDSMIPPVVADALYVASGLPEDLVPGMLADCHLGGDGDCWTQLTWDEGGGPPITLRELFDRLERFDPYDRGAYRAKCKSSFRLSLVKSPPTFETSCPWVLHVERQKTVNVEDVAEEEHWWNRDRTLACLKELADSQLFIGLTTAVVLGTIGDVEPTLDVVAKNYEAAITSDEDGSFWDDKYRFVEGTAGWTASDFLSLCPSFTKSLRDSFGSAKGTLKVTTLLWNRVCEAWGGRPFEVDPIFAETPGSFPQDAPTPFEEWHDVPERAPGPHHRTMPDDFVLVTHVDHCERFAPLGYEMRPIPVVSKDFIKLGQDILANWQNLEQILKMLDEVFKGLQVAHQVGLESDLIYLVSGTTFHYFLCSLFPEKQVYEVCPVPREDNGVCPEFYLANTIQWLTKDPGAGFQLGRLFFQHLVSRRYLNSLEWSGHFEYKEAPKFHSVSPWAADKWKIRSPNVGFKPYDDFVVKTSWHFSGRIRAYLSLGSCVTLSRATYEAVGWLRSLPVDWFVDQRWAKLIPGCAVVPFVSHALELHKFDWVVHHGGSGITNTCLHVKVPQTILPQIGDQFVWAEALSEQVVPVGVSVPVLLGLLYTTWDPTHVDDPPQWLEPVYVERITRLGGRWVLPFQHSKNCCHDVSTYGWPYGIPSGDTWSPDQVIAEVGEYWIVWRTAERPCLKWVAKRCGPGPALDWIGTLDSASYPHHPHGWVAEAPENWAIPASLYNSLTEEFKLQWAALNPRTQDRFNPHRKVELPTDLCDICGLDGHLHGNWCTGCLRQAMESSPSVALTHGARPVADHRVLKPPDKSLIGTRFTVGAGVRSNARYWVADTRCLRRAPNRQVAYHLLSRATHTEELDEAYLEAFWSYCGWIPPHYQFRHNYEPLVREAVDMFGQTDLDRLFSDCADAVGGVLSVSSVYAIFERAPWRLLTPNGIRRSFEWSRWHVLVDGLRHFEPLMKEFGHPGLPGVCSRFQPLPHAEFTSHVSWGSVLPKPLSNAVLSNAWLKRVSSQDGLYLHFFALRLPLLGPDFGLFHVVVEYGGRFWQLKQKSGMRVFIDVSTTPPEATSERPLVKTIQVHNQRTGSLTERWISQSFDDISYRVLGDNCLVFGNFLVYLLTGTVVPWNQFGLFGQDLSKPWGALVGELLSSYWNPEGAQRVALNHEIMATNWTWFGGLTEASREPSWVGPEKKPLDYGLSCVRRVQAFLEAEAPGGAEDTPWSERSLMDLALTAYKCFGLSATIFTRALVTVKLRHIQVRRRDIVIWQQIRLRLAQIGSSRLARDVKNFGATSVEVLRPFRLGKKVAWAPLFNISTPLHWFKSGPSLVEHRHLPENLELQPKRRTAIDLREIAQKYRDYFPTVDFPDLDLKEVGRGEYEVGVKIHPKRHYPSMDDLTFGLIQKLQEVAPFEMGIYSLRFATEKMAEAITDRYFTGAIAAGDLIPEEAQQQIAEGIFRNEEHLYANAQLISPEEVWKKWNTKYSAGFPFRFSTRGQEPRIKLVEQAGGKEAFLQCVRDYIQSPEYFPTVSHAFIKEEVLPVSYVERQKIRTVIAQDPLNYFAAMAVQGDHAKRIDPTSFSAVGVSAAHGEMVALAQQHVKYKHHYAMDITAMDSTAALDAVETIKRLRKLGFKDHPQYEAVASMIDLSYDNLVSSWIVDIHTGRARHKEQGLSTGHATTTAANTDYMRVLMLYAWTGVTGMSVDDFYQCVKFSSYSDDNFWSTNLSPSVFSAQKIADFWQNKGVQVRVEGASDNLSDISFLAKRFTFDPTCLQEAREIAGVDVEVGLVHDRGRLLTKFSDFKKRNTLTYRWERAIALQLNCCHLRTEFELVDRYLDALEPELSKRAFGRRFMKQHPRVTYEDVVRLSYAPNRKTRSALTVSTFHGEHTLIEKLEGWWDTFKVDVMTFDAEVNSFARVLQNISGLLELGGLTPEDMGYWLKDPGQHFHDDQFTLEHHCYLLNGCPESFDKFIRLATKSPFSAFMDCAGFWARRNYYSISEETANALRCKVTMLLGFYAITVWMEAQLKRVPVIGPMYNLFVASRDISGQAFSKLNSLYWLLWGDSSMVLSALVPKDRYLPTKTFAHRLWVNFTATDLFDLSGDLDPYRRLFDAMVLLVQDVNGLVFEGDWTVLLPVPGTASRLEGSQQSTWNGLDHSDSVNECLRVLGEGRTPLITGPTGCGKSTDFILSLAKRFDTVYVSCPRRILVQENPVAQVRLYQGCQDTLTPGLINFGTSGYLRRAMPVMAENSILVLDEFHELDEDTLWLLSRFEGHVITVSATPEFSGSTSLEPVTLTKSRNPGYHVTEVLLDTPARLPDAWAELIAQPELKTLVVVKGPTEVEELVRHAQAYMPGKRVCPLYRGQTKVTEADWYFGTAVVDAGLTIPGLEHVIDTGWSRGFAKGAFVTRPSSHNVSEQRRGRTGRTCSGRYTRLMLDYCDDPWDPSTPFIFNEWDVVARWYPAFPKPSGVRPGCLSSLPPGYEKLLENHDWSTLIYLTFLYENRGDVSRARSMYADLTRFPERPEFSYYLENTRTRRFKDLEHVEETLVKYRFDGEDANMWKPRGEGKYLLEFKAPIPRQVREENLY